jgi:hypothetical protein
LKMQPDFSFYNGLWLPSFMCFLLLSSENPRFKVSLSGDVRN